MSDDTVRAYDRFATDYWRRRADRSGLAAHHDGFARRVGPGGLVLDAGCGPAFDARELRARGLRTVGLDLSRGMLALAAERYPTALVRGDLRAVPFRAAFAGVWACASLLHLPRADVPTALVSLRGALKAGGCLYLSMKRGAGETREPYPLPEPGDPETSPSRRFVFWAADELDGALQDAGFVLEESGVRPGGRHGWLYRFARVT